RQRRREKDQRRSHRRRKFLSRATIWIRLELERPAISFCGRGLSAYHQWQRLDSGGPGRGAGRLAGNRGGGTADTLHRNQQFDADSREKRGGRTKSLSATG